MALGGRAGGHLRRPPCSPGVWCFRHRWGGLEETPESEFWTYEGLLDAASSDVHFDSAVAAVIFVALSCTIYALRCCITCPRRCSRRTPTLHPSRVEAIKCRHAKIVNQEDTQLTSLEDDVLDL